MGLNVYKVKALCQELMRLGSKLPEAAARLIINETPPSFPQRRGRLLLKTHLASPREMPEGDVEVLRGSGKQVFIV